MNRAVIVPASEETLRSHAASPSRLERYQWRLDFLSNGTIEDGGLFGKPRFQGGQIFFS